MTTTPESPTTQPVPERAPEIWEIDHSAGSPAPVSARRPAALPLRDRSVNGPTVVLGVLFALCLVIGIICTVEANDYYSDNTETAAVLGGLFFTFSAMCLVGWLVLLGVGRELDRR